MKLQQLAVIFVIIVLPISLVLSMYTDNNIDVIEAQADYDSILLTATNDAVNAYQMNTLRNGYSTINDSKIRDISASVNSFFNSLASGLGSSGYSKEDLESYVPALLFTLYDGYYLYGDYQNIVTLNGGVQNYSNLNSNQLSSQSGIKPFIYYTCEYQGANKFDIVINYTLDNYITVMGTDTDGNIVNMSGYLVNTNNINVNGDSVTAHGIQIEPEILGEYIVAIDTVPKADNPNATEYKSNNPEYFQYIYYNNQKYYIDEKYNSDSNVDNKNRVSSTHVTYTSDDGTEKGIDLFRLNNNLRVYLNENEANTLATFLGLDNFTQINSSNFIDKSAINYYKNAKEFSNKFIQLFNNASSLKIVTESFNNQLNYTAYNEETDGQVPIHSRYDYMDDLKSVFDITDPDNDPETESSLFNEHRMDVIISSIESNLLSIISNFNIHYNSGFEFSLPVLSEEDWYTITNNITVVSFLQGIPIGNYKYFSNYSIATNTKNKEFVSRDSIILRTKETGIRNTDINGSYHNPRCLDLNGYGTETVDNSNLIGYNIIDYQQQMTSYDVVDPSSHITTDTLVFYYYPHSGSGAYECVIGREDILFTSDNLINGTGFESMSDAYDNANPSQYEGAVPNENVRKAYITALAREKNSLYKVSEYFNNY